MEYISHFFPTDESKHFIHQIFETWRRRSSSNQGSWMIVPVCFWSLSAYLDLSGSKWRCPFLSRPSAQPHKHQHPFWKSDEVAEKRIRLHLRHIVSRRPELSGKGKLYLFDMLRMLQKTHVGHNGKKAVGQKTDRWVENGGILRQDGTTTTTATTTVPNFKRSPDQHFCRVFFVGWEVALKWDHTECYQRPWHDAAREDRDTEGRRGEVTGGGALRLWMVNEALAMIIEDTPMKHCKALLELEHEDVQFIYAGYGLKQSFALFKGLVSKISTSSFAFFCFLLA